MDAYEYVQELHDEIAVLREQMKLLEEDRNFWRARFHKFRLNNPAAIEYSWEELPEPREPAGDERTLYPGYEGEEGGQG